MIQYILTIGVTLFTLDVFAQDDWEDAGEIENAEVVIEKDRKIELPPATRTFEKIAPERLNRELIPQNYIFNDYTYSGLGYSPSLRPERIEATQKGELSDNYVKLGFGNFISPLAELSLNAGRNNLTGGIDFQHLSFARGPVDGSSSGSSDNLGRAFVNLYGKTLTSSTSLNFSSVKRYHYGFSNVNSDSRIDPTTQTYNTIAINTLLSNSAEAAVPFEVRLGFYNVSDNFSASELGFNAGFDFETPITDEFLFFSQSDALLSKYEDQTSINRNIIKSLNGVKFQLGRFSLKGGVNLAIANDTIANANDFKVYPYANAQLKIASTWNLEGGITGDLQAVTLKTLSQENPFIAEGISLNHTNQRINLFSKVSGSINDQVALRFGASFSNNENLYFYTDSLRFQLSYETDGTDVLRLDAGVDLTFGRDIQINSSIQFFNYNTKTIAEAWHRPQFTWITQSSFRVSEKLKLNLEGNLISGIKALDPATDTEIDLDTIIDLGIGANYQIKKQLAGFISLNNLLNREYERFLRYQNRGIMGHLGIIYSF